MDGVLVVDKPSGPTSFEVVRRVRRSLGVRRVGHGGTLDPLASGVLPICIGEATKLAPFLLDADKEYVAEVCFGVETDSYDAAGAVTSRAATDAVTEDAVRAALAAFTGPIDQLPPLFSALKHKGRRLYDYARAGEAPERAPRRVQIYELELATWRGPASVTLRLRCSKGTYVRSLAFDLGRALGVGAHLAALRRTRSGPFTIEQAVALRDDAFVSGAVIPTASVLTHLPAIPVSVAVARDLACGKRLPLAALTQGDPGPRFRVIGPNGALVAVAEATEDRTVRTLRVFNDARADRTEVSSLASAPAADPDGSRSSIGTSQESPRPVGLPDGKTCGVD